MRNTRKLLVALVLVMTILMTMAMAVIPASAAKISGGTKLYLVPSANWNQDNARFAAYFFGDGDAWVSMTKVAGESNLYEVTSPAGKNFTNVIFCRMNPSNSTNGWGTNQKWNQTADLVYNGTSNCYTVKEGTWDKGGGTWSSYGSSCSHANVGPAATCTNDQVCLDCGDPVASALGHTYNTSHLCTRCNEQAPFTVAGTGAHLGTEWDTGNTANDMTYADGVYTKVYTKVAAGSYKFKVVRDHDWGTAYPADDKAYTVAESGSTVTITLKGTAVDVKVEVPVVECTHEWADATCDKPQTCKLCGKDQGEALGHAFNADGVCTVCEYAPSYIIAGDVMQIDGAYQQGTNFFGNSWNANDTNNKMGYSAELGLFAKTYTGVKAGEYHYQVTSSGSWFGVDNCYIKVDSDNSTVTITFNPNGNVMNAIVEAHVHSWSDATCTEPAKCECGETNGEAAGHNYVDGVCSACGEAAPCEHEFEQNVFYHPELVAATCCTPGVAVYECTKCDYYYTEATDIDPEAHAFWGDREVITAANCATKTNGLVKVSCDNGCGQFNEVEIEYSEAHDWDVQKETYATCTEGGEYYAVCTICSEVESYSVPASGHYNWFVTCGQSGTCMECGAEFTADPHTVTPCEGGMCTNCWETFEPLGHSFVDGVCSACGAEDPNHVPAETKWTFWLSNDSLYAVDGYNIKYNVAGNTYACVGTADVVALAVGNNTFTVTITNNGTAASRVRVDIQGTNTIGNHNVCNVSAVGGDVWTDHDWGGSIVTVPAGESVTLVITYDAEGEFGAVKNLIFFVDAMRGDDTQYSSDITVSDMAFSYVSNEPAHENTLVVGDTNKIVISESNSINNGYGYYVVWVPFVAEEKAHYTFAGENLAIYIYDAAYTFLSDNGTADLEAGNYLICIAYNALATFGEYNVAVTKTEIAETPVEPPHEHNFVEGKCECGESDPNYVVPPVEDEPTEKPEDKPEETPADPKPEEPAVELNFFQKIWLAILAFLKKLFGIEF